MRKNFLATTTTTTRTIPLAVLLVVLLFAVLISIAKAKGDNEDRQLLMAYNAAFHELVASGEYDRMLTKWGIDPASSGYSTCSDGTLNQWPSNPVGNFKAILENSKTISFGHADFSNEPFWNGNSGLEDDIAKGVTERIRKHYGVQDLVMRWVNPLIDASGFFESLYKNLDSYGSDIVLSAVSITPQREELVDFTCAYLSTPDTILRSGLDPERNLSTLEQLNAADVQVVVVHGTIYEEIADSRLALATVTTVNAVSDAVEMVTTSQVHAFIDNSIAIKIALDNEPCSNCTTHNFHSSTSLAAFVRKSTESDTSSSPASTVTAASSTALLLRLLLVAAMVMLALLLLLL